jgi:hypothetical protein
MKLLLLLGSGILLVLGITGSSAFAAKPGAGTCSGGTPGTPQIVSAGTYDGFTVSGNCVFGPGTMTINGHLTIADGGVLNDHASGLATVHITGNVKVGKGAVLGLGDYDHALPHDSAIVDGNITAHRPATLYLGGMTVHGNVVSNGGGTADRNFPIKDNTIDGNLILQGWSGLWMGAIRNHVGGNVNVSKNTALDTSVVPGIDSTEVMTNVIAGNLICHDNTPTAQINVFDGGQPNVVSGNSVGECPPRMSNIPTS